MCTVEWERKESGGISVIFKTFLSPGLVHCLHFCVTPLSYALSYSGISWNERLSAYFHTVFIVSLHVIGVSLSIFFFFNQGMIQQLIDYNLRHGALSVRTEVRTLLCLLTRDNRRGTEEMNNLVMTRIAAAIKGHQSNPDLVRRHFLCLP